MILIFFPLGLVALQQKAALAEENCLKRRQSLPASPAGLVNNQKTNQKNDDDNDEVFVGNGNLKRHFSGKKNRRSSIASLRNGNSCKIS